MTATTPTSLRAVARRAGALLAVLSFALIALAGPSHASGAGDNDYDALDGMSLVWLDSSTGRSADLWVAGADGADPRLVAGFPSGTRVLAMSGALMALDVRDRLVVVDLVSGEQRDVELPRSPRGAVFGGDGLLFVTTAGNRTCAPDPLELPQPSRLVRVDLATGDAQVIAVSSGGLLDVLSADAGTREVVVLPRGCDVGIGELRLYDMDSGELRRTVSARGCGWATVAPEGVRALVGWESCTVPDAHTGAIATLVDLTSGEGRDITAVTNAAARGPFLFSPDGARIAVGGSFGGVVGRPGSTTGAVWLADAATLELRPLAQGLAREAVPLDWSPDGRFLLVSAVQAQGFCSLGVVDTVTGDVRPIAENITVCGVNGEVTGWTALGDG